MKTYIYKILFIALAISFGSCEDFLDERPVAQENTELRVDGVVGEDGPDLPKVSIETKYGGVKLIH